MTTSRPGLYPYHDVTGTNITYPEDSAFLFTGYVANVTPVPSADHNGKFNRAGFWLEYLDRNGITNEDWIDTAATALLTLTSLTYNVGGNVLTTGATVNARGTYLINATRVETDTPFLNPVGGSVAGDPLIYPGATVPGRIWVYAGANGQVRYDSVAPATADAPGVNEISLIGLDVNALGVVTDGAVVPVTLPLPDWRLPIVTPLYLDGNDTMLSVIAGDAPGGDPAVFFDGQSGTGLSVQANSVDSVAVFKQTGAGHAVVAQGSVSITTNLTASGNSSFGAGAGNTTTTVGADSSDVLAVVAVATFTNLVTCNGDVVIGNADTDALTVAATATFNNNVNLGVAAGNKTVTVGADNLDTFTCNAASTFNANIIFGTNTITGAGGTITTSTVNSSVVVPTEIRYNTGVGAAPTANGRTGYDGRSLTIGDGTAARQYHTPKRVYVISDATTLASEDIAGASIAMEINDSEWVYFRLTAAHLITGGGDTFFCRLAATNGVDSTVVLNSGDDDAATYGFTFGANGKITQSIIVRWKPTNDVPVPNNTSWTIRAVHGIAGGNTLTTSNVEIEGWYEPT